MEQTIVHADQFSEEKRSDYLGASVNSSSKLTSECSTQSLARSVLSQRHGVYSFCRNLSCPSLVVVARGPRMPNLARVSDLAVV
jgi:hypothetical protein